MGFEERLSDFMLETASTLGRIEANQINLQSDVTAVQSDCKKIPLMEQGLNNHLTAHNNMKKLFIWPVSAIVVGSTIVGILKFIFKLF